MRVWVCERWGVCEWGMYTCVKGVCVYMTGVCL